MPTSRADTSHVSAGPASGRTRFLWTWLIAVLVAAAAGLPLVNLLLLNWRSNPNVRWVDELWQRKAAMAQAAAGQPRIFIVGGSSALFSIDAEVLQARLGRPVINLGMMQGLGLRHTLDDAREVMARGDTVLLHIEYEAYQWKDELTDYQRQVLLTNHPARIWHLPWRKAVELTYAAPWSDYAAGWQRRNEELRPVRPSAPLKEVRYTSVELSPSGDCRGDGAPESPGFRRYPLAPLKRGVGPESAALLHRFVQDCGQRGVRVLAMRPAGLPQGNPAPELIEAAYRGLESFYAGEKVRLLNTRDVFVVPRALMLDTAYHANAGGRRVITEAVLGELRLALGLAAPAGQRPLLLAVPLDHNGRGREVIRPEQELAGCFFLSEQDLQHPACITPAAVREFVRAGQTVLVNDREAEAILRKTDLVLAPGQSKRSTLADWFTAYRDHCFVLAQVGAFDASALADDKLPATVRFFLKDRTRCKVGIFGTGRYASIDVRRGKSHEAGLERSRYSELARAFRHPLDIALLSTPQPLKPGELAAPPDRCAIRIDHYAIEDGATAGLAVAILDPKFGRVVKHATFTGPELLEWQQYEVRLPANPGEAVR